MKESRSSLLVALSTLLIILSVTLLGIWGYTYYKSKQIQPLAVQQKLAPSTPLQITKDSLQQIYSQTISQLDSTWTNADSLKNTLDVKLSDFYRLRSEITDILKNNPSTADLSVAKQKIQELQLRVEILRNRNNDIESENKRLNALLKQYTSASKKSGGTSFTATEKIDVLEADKTPTSSGLFAASQIKIMALSAEGDKETMTADEVEKITGTFVVKNTAPLNGAEIIIIVMQPNGKVLKNSAWETGIFETKEDGRKMYSQKIKFDYNKGETKRCNFSVIADNFPKGNYTFQIYHNGVLIANTVKTLS
jgi:hypothetical protein